MCLLVGSLVCQTDDSKTTDQISWWNNGTWAKKEPSAADKGADLVISITFFPGLGLGNNVWILIKKKTLGHVWGPDLYEFQPFGAVPNITPDLVDGGWLH